MDINNMIEQWIEKHSSILADYNKGNVSNEVMQMYRSQMKNILEFIEQLKQIKTNVALVDTNQVLPSSCINGFEKPEYCSQRNNNLCQKCINY